MCEVALAQFGDADKLARQREFAGDPTGPTRTNRTMHSPQLPFDPARLLQLVAALTPVRSKPQVLREPKDRLHATDREVRHGS
jgi:hypothetical protein